MTNRLCLGYHALSSKFGLKVSLPGKNVLTVSNAIDFAFNSEWSEQMNVISSGSSYASTTDIVGGRYLLTTFSTQSFTPHVWLWARGESYSGGMLGVSVSTSEIRVVDGNVIDNFTRPSYLISYVIFNSSLV